MLRLKLLAAPLLLLSFLLGTTERDMSAGLRADGERVAGSASLPAPAQSLAADLLVPRFAPQPAAWRAPGTGATANAPCPAGGVTRVRAAALAIAFLAWRPGLDRARMGLPHSYGTPPPHSSSV